MALSAGRPADALLIAQRAVEAAEFVGSIFSKGLAHRFWALARTALDPRDRAGIEAHCKESLAALHAGHAHLEAARTLVAWALLCRAWGATAEARTRLQRATAQFKASGLGAELERTESILRNMST